MFLVALGVLIAAMFFAAAEAALRWYDAGAERGYFAEVVRPDSTRVLRLAWNPQRNVPAAPQPQREFLADKPRGTFRIFVIGESSAEGIPYEPSYSFAAWLARRLAREIPDVPVEVVNAAVAGATSESMLAMVRDIARHQPDLLAVYLGHNEIGGHLTAEERAHFDPQRFNWRAVLARSHLYRFAARMLPGTTTTFDPHIRIGSPKDFASDADRDVMMQLYRTRVEEMIAIMRGVGTQTALLTLSENFSDWEPVVSVHREGLSAADEAQWDAAVAQGDAVVEKDCNAALAAWRRAMAIDDQHAQLNYKIAGCLRSIGRIDEAFAAYRRASDLDRFTQGAYTSMNDILRDIAQRQGVWLVDVDAMLARESGAHLVGDDLFVDAMHPNMRAHQLIAQAVADKMRSVGIPKPSDRWRVGAYTDPDVRTIMQADPELRVRELEVRGFCCLAAGREDCARESFETAARITTSDRVREAILRGLNKPASPND